MLRAKVCLICNEKETDINVTKCKSCNRASLVFKDFDIPTPDDSESPNRITSYIKDPQKKALSHSARIAIESANIVNSYGSVLQVIGIVVGVFWIILGIIASKEDGLYVILGLTIGGLTITISVVQGAFLRMISNYVKAKLEIASSNN